MDVVGLLLQRRAWFFMEGDRRSKAGALQVMKRQELTAKPARAKERISAASAGRAWQWEGPVRCDSATQCTHQLATAVTTSSRT